MAKKKVKKRTAKSNVKRLYRAKEKDSILGGVCAGLADYFDLDPVLVRVLWILVTVFSAGLGIFGYLASWVIMPRK